MCKNFILKRLFSWQKIFQFSLDVNYLIILLKMGIQHKHIWGNHKAMQTTNMQTTTTTQKNLSPLLPTSRYGPFFLGSQQGPKLDTASCSKWAQDRDANTGLETCHVFSCRGSLSPRPQPASPHRGPSCLQSNISSFPTIPHPWQTSGVWSNISLNPPENQQFNLLENYSP